MSKPETAIKITAVGQVEHDESGFQIVVNEPYRAGLTEVDQFGYLVVLWWAHLLDQEGQRCTMEFEQPYKKGPSVMGVFATRAPMRPNPIGITVVAVQEVDQAAGIIQVPFIDVEPGTPVIDLKPYHPAFDRVKKVSMPSWCSHWPQWYEDSARFEWEAEGL